MELTVDLNRISFLAEQMSGYGRTLESYGSRINSIENNCPFSGATRAGVRNALKHVMNEVDETRRVVYKMKDSLDNVQRIYSSYEQEIASLNGTEDSGNINGSNSVSKEDGEGEAAAPGASGNIIWEAIGKAGLFGNLVSMVGKGTVNGWDIVGVSSGINGIVGNGADVYLNWKQGGTGNSDWKKYLYGGNDVLSDLDIDLTQINKTSPGKWNWGTIKSTAKNAFGKSMKQQFIDDLGFNGAATTAEKVKVGTQWAGHILTLAGNGVENYEEAGGFTGRMVAETAVETAVDIAVGAAATSVVTAGIAAGAAALGATVAAPAVVVGAGAAVVAWGANEICKWATGGSDLGEVAADLVCNAGEAVVKSVKNIGSGLKTAWSKLWD